MDIQTPEETAPVPRGSLFSVRDVEDAILWFSGLFVIYLASVCVYELSTGWRGFLATGWTIFVHSPSFLGFASCIIIFKEGVGIMFWRLWKEARAQHAAEVAQAKNAGLTQGKLQGRAEGKAEGKVEGKAEGKAEAYQQWNAWNARRLDAAAKGEPFNEAPPEPPK